MSLSADHLPQITILIVTLNNERSLPECLRRIREQDYPKNKIDYLNIDGGSHDATSSLMKSAGFRTVESPIKHNAEAQRAVGLQKAKHNLIVSLDADNYLPDAGWLRKMVQPFIDNPSVVHAGTLHYTYRKNDTAFNRYCALFGVVDPVVFYMGKADRMPQYVRAWNNGIKLSERPEYSIIRFTKDTLPTVGCNGVIYRKDLLLKHAKSTPKDFIHIDVFIDLISKGFDVFAVVNAGVIHDTAVDLRSLMRKRMLFLKYYNMNRSVNRRYYVFNPESNKDRKRLFLFIVYTITIVRPLMDSIRGFISIPDAAWFLHPVMCWVYLIAYTRASLAKIK